MSGLFLAGAIICEVCATLGLRAALDNTRWYAAVVVGYLLAFTSLSASLAHGMPLGVAYGVWTATGVALTALLGTALFKERFTPKTGVGIALIMVGVLLVELGAH